MLIEDLWMLNSSTWLYQTSIVLGQNPIVEELFNFFYILFREWSRREWKVSGVMQDTCRVLGSFRRWPPGLTAQAWGLANNRHRKPGWVCPKPKAFVPNSPAAHHQKLFFVPFHFLLSCCCKFAFRDNTGFKMRHTSAQTLFRCHRLGNFQQLTACKGPHISHLWRRLMCL